jgi:hypothetical protein
VSMIAKSRIFIFSSMFPIPAVDKSLQLSPAV